MNEPKLGKIITDVVHKDAVHFALAPVVAAGPLKPGMHIGFVTPGNTELVDEATKATQITPIGIVDPFIVGTVREGQCFWMMLYPGTITGLRHEWTHPAFQDQREIAKWWMRDFLDKLGSYEHVGMEVDELIDHIKEYVANPARNTIAGFGTDIEYPDEATEKEFWKYAQILIGPVDKEVIAQGAPFRCAC